jgi:hypothetical protein
VGLFRNKEAAEVGNTSADDRRAFGDMDDMMETFVWQTSDCPEVEPWVRTSHTIRIRRSTRGRLVQWSDGQSISQRIRVCNRTILFSIFKLDCRIWIPILSMYDRHRFCWFHSRSGDFPATNLVPFDAPKTSDGDGMNYRLLYTGK